MHDRRWHCLWLKLSPLQRRTALPFSSLPFLIALATLVAATAFPVSTDGADLREVTKLFRSGQYGDCIEGAAEAIDQGETSEALRVLKIRAEMELGRYPDALRTLEEGLARFPTSVQLRWYGRDVLRHHQQADRAATLDEEMTELITRTPWRYSDVANQLIVGRFLLSQHMDPKKVLDGIYNEAKRHQPNYADVYLAIGEVALEKHDYELAGDSYQQAAKLDSANADAHLGVARAFAPTDSKKADESIKLALKCNPNHVPSLLMMVDSHIDAEEYDQADKILAQVIAINPHQSSALAYQAVLAHLRNQPENEKKHRDAALRHWPTNPEVDYLIGKKLSQNYRFAEGEKYQRAALEIDSDYLPAKTQLSQDLLRLGKEEEGWKLAEEVYAADGYNLFAHNLVELQENLAKFRTLEADGITVRMDAREADIYGARVLDLLTRAKRELCAKYDVELKQPVTVEIFPKQQDFAIRTFGLPGGAGFLGVCFGAVITANSPASQGARPSCWEATLWHEFCHVVTLQKTDNKMPRWLSEGISVYEERQADPSWGQSINPQYREMILGDDLTPVSELSGAFLSPKTPLHLQFAYFESSLVVEYFIEKHGLEVLKRILVDLGVGMPINDALARYAGSIGSVDEEFAKYARERAKNMAPGADWSEPELPRRANAELISAWLKDHPNSYPALKRLAEKLIAEKQWEAAKAPLEKMKELYPEDVSSTGPYRLLAKVYREVGEPAEERAVLEKVAELSADDLDVFARLAELASEAGDWTSMRKYVLRSLGVNPLVPGPHRTAAMAAVQLEDHPLAIVSNKALLALAPFDTAEIHLNLATSLQKTGDLNRAKRHALLALEETPRYRAAQRRLLEIIDQAKASDEACSETVEAEQPAEVVAP